jgi:tetrahydromethanopterin S-methyltransferase subunit E
MRILIAIAAYIFSSYGISASLGLTLLSISMIAEPLMFDSLQSYLSFVAGFVVLYAWIVHLIMCISWIADKKINKFWPISGTIAGTLSFYVCIRQGF